MNIPLSAPGSVLPGRFGQQTLAAHHAIARPTRDEAKRAVRISPAAQQLSGLPSGDADVHLDRVHALRAAIATGTLTIDTRRIADGLIHSALELLGEETSRACTTR